MWFQVRHSNSSLRQGLISSRLRLPRIEAAAVRRFLANPWLWAVLAVTALAAFLRLYQLADIPPGITGDEGLVGLNARRILDEGWIGAYVTTGYGINSGPMYLTAPFVWLLGNTVLAIRLPVAILGAATIPVAYVAFREMTGKTAALIAAFILAVSLWHIQLSRIAFTVNSWPLMEVATLAAVFWAFRTRSLALFVLAGALMGLGVHTYPAWPLFAGGMALFFVWALIRGGPMARPELLRGLALFSIAAFIGALPLIREALDSSSLYRNDGARTAALIFNHPTYEQQGGFFDRAGFLASRAWDYFRALTWEAKLDAADMLGLAPILDRFTSVLALAGLAYMAVKWRQPAHVLVWIMILILPALAVFTVDGSYRRTFGLTPFISLAAAMPLALVWEYALKLKPVGRWALLGAVVLVLALIARVNVVRYFDTFANSPSTSWSFVEDLTKASEYTADLPGQPYVYLYSGRFLYPYETQRYLLPGRPGEDRSREHGQFTLEPDRSKDVVYLFLEPYFDLLPQVQALYPGGIAHQENRSNGQPLFSVYYLPRETAGATAVSPIR